MCLAVVAVIWDHFWFFFHTSNLQNPNFLDHLESFPTFGFRSCLCMLSQVTSASETN